MTPLRTLVAVLFFATIFVASNIWTRASIPGPVAVITAPVADTTSVSDAGMPALHSSANDSDDPRLDLNGNEIDEAVGDYRLDTRGEMYERHAPDTALLHLGAPRL
jgi:hypothetical protein